MGLAAGFTFLWSQSSKSWDAELCNYNILISMGGTELALQTGTADLLQGCSQGGCEGWDFPPGSSQRITLSSPAQDRKWEWCS